MDINIRKVEPYVDVTVTIDSTKVEMGLMDSVQAGQFASDLIAAASELEYAFRPGSALDKILDKALEITSGEI
jgi:hypothetical protein